MQRGSTTQGAGGQPSSRTFPADVVPGRRRRADPPRSRRREYFGRGEAAPVGVSGSERRWLSESGAEIVIVQPGLKRDAVTPDQSAVLAATYSFLNETINAAFD